MIERCRRVGRRHLWHRSYRRAASRPPALPGQGYPRLHRVRQDGAAQPEPLPASAGPHHPGVGPGGRRGRAQAVFPYQRWPGIVLAVLVGPAGPRGRDGGPMTVDPRRV